MSNVKDRVSEQVESIAVDSKEFVEEHAISSALVVFGIGIGAGLAIASLLTNSGQARHSTMTQRLGQQMLEAMGRVLPDSIMKS